MKRYRVLTNYVSRKYQIGDTFTEEQFSDKRMLEYHLQQGNLEVVEDIIEDKKHKRSRKEATNIVDISDDE